MTVIERIDKALDAAAAAGKTVERLILSDADNAELRAMLGQLAGFLDEGATLSYRKTLIVHHAGRTQSAVVPQKAAA